VSTVLKRAWVPLVVVVAVVLGGVAVDRLRGVFGSDAILPRRAAALNHSSRRTSSG